MQIKEKTCNHKKIKTFLRIILHILKWLRTYDSTLTLNFLFSFRQKILLKNIYTWKTSTVFFQGNPTSMQWFKLVSFLFLQHRIE